ncbi:MAG: hypothetical protein O3B24_02670, partial [Verrucomicrobia bacterium]|nr:hypothetical protein [Verrucomicrobiota bacterium]
ESLDPHPERLTELKQRLQLLMGQLLMGAYTIQPEAKDRKSRRRKTTMNKQGAGEIPRSFTQPTGLDRIAAATDLSGH